MFNLFDDYPPVQLTPGAPPGPMTGPAGPATLPPNPAGPPSRWQRLQNALMPVPRGLDGLLSDDDIKHARRMGLLNFGLSMLDQAHGDPMGGNAPSFGQAAARSIKAGIGGYDQNLQSSVQQGVAGADLAQKRAILLNRQRVAQQFAPQPNETSQQTVQRLKGMYLEYLRAGDTDMAGKLGEVVSKLFSDTEHPVEHVDLGNRTAIIDPKTGAPIRYEQNGPKPKSPEELGAATRFNATQTNSILDDYRTDTKQYHAALDGYKVLKGALTNQSLATPFAVLDAYARVVNPGAAVRQGTMAVLQEMGSYDQHFRRWLDMATQGQWPPDMIASIKGTLDAIMNEHHKEYADSRRRAIARGTTFGLDIGPLLDRDVQEFGTDPSAPGGTSGGSTAQRFKIKPTR